MNLVDLTYEQMLAGDIIEPLIPHIDAGILTIRLDGKIHSVAGDGVPIDTPWLHINSGGSRDCRLWNGVMFRIYGLCPIGCQQCWKVVVKPRTIRELFIMHGVMKKMRRDSKLGVELRTYTSGLYGCYFYNNSKEQGLECYDAVRKVVDEAIGPDVKVILKRGCTEIEQKFGPSNKWESIPGQEMLEARITAAFEYPPQGEQPSIVKAHVVVKWMKFAAAHDDPTVTEFNGGKPIGKAEYVTYHEERRAQTRNKK